MSTITDIQLSTNDVLNWFLQGKTKEIVNEPFYVKRSIYNHLLEVFKKIEKSDAEEIQISLKQYSKKDYQGTSLESVHAVTKILERNKKYFKYFLIHGSSADLKIIPGWSDFDSLAVIKEAPMSSEDICNLLKICLDLDEEMRKIDKFQHHGIHFIHEKELKTYPQIYLPYQALVEAKCLLGSKKISIKPIDSRKKEIARFDSIVKTFKDASTLRFLDHHPLDDVFLEESFRNDDTMYQLKYFLSVIMLLPTLWFNIQDVYCSKGESFNLIKNHFSDEDLEILTKSSLIRENWRPSEAHGNKIPEWIKAALGEDYLSRGYKFSKNLQDNLWKH